MKRVQWVVTSVVLAGCMVQTSREKLTDALQRYNVALRWGAVEWAEEHVSPKSRSELLARRASFGELQVADCEVGSVKLEGKDRARAMVRIDWYLIRSLRLQTSFVEQRWEFEGGQWLITSQRLVRGAPYPMLINTPEGTRLRRQETWPETSARRS